MTSKRVVDLLEAFDIYYEENGEYGIYIHLVEEPDGSYHFYVTAAGDMFTAIASVSMHGKCMHTEKLVFALDTLKDVAAERLV